MSNFVDILMVDGPFDGMVMCQRKPVPATITHMGSTYTTDTYERIHVAYHDPDNIVANIDTLIEANNLQPSWDLPA